MKKYITGIKIIGITLFLLGLVKCGLYLKNDFGYDTRDQIFVSPSGQTTVRLRYDFASRPFLFYDNQKVFEYNGSGFMESVYFDIQWVSEKEVRLYTQQYDESYTVYLDNSSHHPSN